MNGCPSEETLAALASRRISEAARHQLEEHFDACSECRVIAASLLRSDSTARRSSDHNQLGKVGRFEIERILGKGAMGVVYLARDPVLRRRVAVKILRGETTLQEGDEARAHLLREARTMAQLSHENVISVHEVGIVDGDLFIAMEYVEGETLRQWAGESRRDYRALVEHFCAAGRGLDAAHKAGLIHRDFKPDNVLVGKDGRVRVLDFGLARSVRADDRGEAPEDDVPTTESGMIIGTPAYMSKEQWLGEPARPSMDQFSFCASLYELVYNARPFGTGLAMIRERVLRGDVEAPPECDVPKDIFAVISRGLAPDSADRFPTMEALVAALRSAAFPELDRETCPYVGLGAFQERDAARFFGREREARSIRDKLEDSPVVAIIGPSGVGKSSFVRAKLLPNLRAENLSWRTLEVRPGRHPMAALARTFAAALNFDPIELATSVTADAEANGQRVVLFVDQFEELFTHDHPRAQRVRFTETLVALATTSGERIRVVLSMRSDFVERTAENRQFFDLLTGALVFMPPADRHTLREALIEPSAALGYRFESDALVNQIINELEDAPGALSLLQFAAESLWERRDRDNKIITESSYQHMGTIAGALSIHADRVIGGLASAERSLAPGLFRRLTTGSQSRSLVGQDELEQGASDAAALRRLLKHCVDNRLLVIQRSEIDDRPVVSLIHESLIGNWPRLRRWLAEGREDHLFLQELSAAATQWDSRQRPAGLLWRGESLVDAQRALKRADYQLPVRERAFVKAAERQARRARSLRTLAIALAMTAVAAALILIQRAERVASQRAAEASAEAQRARKAEQRIQSQLETILAGEQATQMAQREAKAKKTLADERQQQVLAKERELAATNADLEEALAIARAESKRAKTNELEANQATAEAVRARSELQVLLDKEKAHVQRLKKRLEERTDVLPE